MLNDQEKNELRKVIGTLPEQVPSIEPIEFLRALDKNNWINNEMGIKAGPFQFYEGVRGITAEMIDFPKNPYKLLYEFAVATWGNEEYPTMWERTKPEHRFFVVKNVLANKALPLGNEALQFSFIIRKPSRAAFDQHSRQRIGATFASQGVRDNSRLMAGFRVPNEIWRDESKRNMIISTAILVKKAYYEIVSSKEGNSYQAARSIMPMGWTHNYKYSVNFMALKGYMAQRLVASEQEDTVATAIMIWDQINKVFPLLANNLRPKCDWAKRCMCHQGDGGDMFGALFKGCGRFPETEGKYATFNYACTDYPTLDAQLGVHLPSPDEWKEYDSLEDLDQKDRILFEE
ncbi:MAG: FAD-dependent thymidylate synthase [Candidatus Pacearchaeota archaeon]